MISKYEKKIYLHNNSNYVYKHRSGWPFAMSLLRRLHSNNGIFFDSFVEKTFGWGNNINKPVIYKEPWIGLFHVPDNVPEWFNNKQTPKEIFKNKYFLESLEYCKGFYCLSEYEKNILKKYTDIPINVIFHPTETPNIKFLIESFISNENKELIQLGTFLRKLSSIFILKTANIKRAALGMNKYNFFQLNKEEEDLNIKIDLKNVKIYDFIDNIEYDKILSKNIAFMDLYDASANNAVIECMVRNTPLLISPNPAIIEYLGENYPFYFKTLEEAAIKAEDIDLIKSTSKYLSELGIKKRLDPDMFIKEILESEIYKNLKPEKVSEFKYLSRLIYDKISYISNIKARVEYLIKKIILSISPKLYFKIKQKMVSKNI